MAHWLPNFETCRSELIESEQIVADSLEEQLPSYASIISNFRWQKTKKNKAPIDLECDFVILWPGRGLVVLEVKGELNYINGTWAGKSRSPTEQARNSRNDICDILARASGENSKEGRKKWRNRCIALPTFPYAAKKDWPGTVDGFDCDQIFTKKDVLNIKQAIYEKTEATTNLCKNLSENKCMILARELLPNVAINPSVENLLQDEQKQIESVTKKQLETVTLFLNFTYIFICGPAGSGKTLLGLTALKAWINAKHDAYYLTSNPYLAQGLQHSFPSLSKKIHSFRSFMEEVLSIRIENTDCLSIRYFTDKFLSYESGDREFHFVLDESQDVNSDFIWALHSLGKVKQLWILYDNQQVLNKKIIPEIFETSISDMIGERIERVPWDINLRNTQKIAKYSSQFVKAELRPCNDNPVGEEPEILYVGDSREQAKEVEKILHRLIEKEEVSPNDIVIISCLEREQILDEYVSNNSNHFGRKLCYMSKSLVKSMIRISTVLDFKGLESKVIILIDTQDAQALNAFYLGGSRAVLRLYIIARETHIDNSTEDFITDMLESDLDI